MEASPYDLKAWSLKTLKDNKIVTASFFILLILIIIGILAPILANNKPLYVSYKGNSLFPAFSFKNNITIKVNGETEIIQYDFIDWKKLKCDKIMFAPVVYSPSGIDYFNADYVSPRGQQYFSDPNGQTVKMPSRFKHWLGTDKLGRDVLAGLIHGTRISLTIGIFSIALSALIGIFLGAVAGYFGDYELKLPKGILWMLIPGLFLGYFYAFEIRNFALKDSLQDSTLAFLFQFLLSMLILAFALLIFFFIGKLLNVFSFFRKKVPVKIDSLVNRLIEILISFPRLILILSVAAITKPSITNLIILIGITSWTDIARLTRAEFLKLRNLEFIEAVRALGYSRRRIIFRHALPNGIAPALVAIAFGIASAILTESGLSFLGIGVPQDVVTWGSLLAEGRDNFSAWWLVIFPGCAIFITVTVFNLFGEGLRDALDPKLRS